MTGDESKSTETARASALAELRSMRADVKALELAVLQLDLAAKQALVRDDLADELVTLHAAEVRARLAGVVISVAAHTTMLELLTAEARGR